MTALSDCLRQHGGCSSLNIRHSEYDIQAFPGGGDCSARRLPRPAPSSLRANWRRACYSLTLAALFVSPAAAGGLEDVAEAPDPCPAGLVVDGSITGEMLAQWRAVRAMSCPDAEPLRRVFYDRATGLPLTDAEILPRIFNGSGPIAPIPLPSGAWLLLGALGLLWRRRA